MIYTKPLDKKCTVYITYDFAIVLDRRFKSLRDFRSLISSFSVISLGSSWGGSKNFTIKPYIRNDKFTVIDNVNNEVSWFFSRLSISLFSSDRIVFYWTQFENVWIICSKLFHNIRIETSWSSVSHFPFDLIRKFSGMWKHQYVIVRSRSPPTVFNQSVFRKCSENGEIPFN